MRIIPLMVLTPTQLLGCWAATHSRCICPGPEGAGMVAPAPTLWASRYGQAVL